MFGVSHTRRALSYRTSYLVVARLVSLVGLLLPTGLAAQDQTYFRPLTVPPRSVGTCVRVESNGNGRDSVGVATNRLVMTSRRLSRRREIVVSVDRAGRAVRYAETGYASTGTLAGEGDDIVAILDAGGRVQGFRLHQTVQMSDSGVARFDTAALRAMREHAATRSSREPLDTDAQRHVRELIKWMRKRCPA